MDELEARCERLLAAYREDDELADADLDRIVGRLAVGLGEAAPPAEVAAPAAVGRVAIGRWIALGLGLSAVAAAAVLWSTRVDRRVADRGPASEAAAWSAPGDAHGGVAQPAVERVAQLPHEPASDPANDSAIDLVNDPVNAPVNDPASDPATDAAIAPSPGPRPPSSRVRSVAAGPEPTPSLADELERIGSAEAQLRTGRASAALATIDRYLRAYPAGRMRPEAEALRTIARCELGRAGARDGATDFLARNPGSASRKRIEAACAEREIDGVATSPDTAGH